MREIFYRAPEDVLSVVANAFDDDAIKTNAQKEIKSFGNAQELKQWLNELSIPELGRLTNANYRLIFAFFDVESEQRVSSSIVIRNAKRLTYCKGVGVICLNDALRRAYRIVNNIVGVFLGKHEALPTMDDVRSAEDLERYLTQLKVGDEGTPKDDEYYANYQSAQGNKLSPYDIGLLYAHSSDDRGQVSKDTFQQNINKFTEESDSPREGEPVEGASLPVKGRGEGIIQTMGLSPKRPSAVKMKKSRSRAGSIRQRDDLQREDNMDKILEAAEKDLDQELIVSPQVQRFIDGLVGIDDRLKKELETVLARSRGVSSELIRLLTVAFSYEPFIKRRILPKLKRILFELKGQSYGEDSDSEDEGYTDPLNETLTLDGTNKRRTLPPERTLLQTHI